MTLARRLSRIALVLALAAAAPAAAQNFTVALSPASAPLANAATQNVASSVSFDVTNTRAGTTISQIDFVLPKFWPSTGGAGPAGWTVVSVSEHNNNTTVRFAVSTCGQGGLANGATGTFRLDLTAATNPSLVADGTDAFFSIAPADPCGGTTGWTPFGPSIIPVKVLWLTASASPAAGASPLATTVTFSVTNETAATKTVQAPTPTVSPGTSYTTTGCTPASRTLAAGASGSFTCGYSFSPSAATSYTVAAAVASSPAGSSAAGAVAGPILVGPATATFAFDRLSAASGDVVRATLSVTNQTGSAIAITPPGYAQLSLANLSRAAGANDPAGAAGVPPGGTRSFVYALAVGGVPGATYAASGTATVTGGTSNLAITPAGTVSGYRAGWLPLARRSGAPAPYQFTVTVQNLSSSSIEEVDVVNPQNGTWTGMANVGATGMTFLGRTTVGGTDTLAYTGALAQNATATLVFQFTGIPAVTTTTAYPFQVRVCGAGGCPSGATNGFPIGTLNVSVAIAVPLPDVAGPSLLSTSTGQTLYWTNTSSANGAHDGVVIFRAAAPAVPLTPVDGTDYTGSPSALYFDKYASPVSALSDPVTGAYHYRVCNHDANLVYSNCNSGFWNGQGYLDSVALPASVTWAHSFGFPIYGYPGEWAGRVGVASNAPSLAVVAASSGQRFFPPTALSGAGLPNIGTPAAPVNGGAATLVFGAATNGDVVAVDLAGGAVPPGWSTTKSGEAFVGGIAGVLRQYVGAAYQASYATDVLLLGSNTTGNLLGIDARTGATLWTKAPATPGATIATQPHYDYGTNRLFVAYDNGGGVVAYGGLGSASAPGTPLWSRPGGSYVTPCTFGNGAGQVACVEGNGTLHVLDGTTGAELLGASGYATGVTSAFSLWPVGDGYVVSNAGAVRRFVVSGGSVTAGYTYSPGLTLSPVLVSVGDGFVYVAASDKAVHKLNLSTLTDTGLSRTVNPAGASPTLAPPAMDVADDLLLFGSSDGRLWAVPVF